MKRLFSTTLMLLLLTGSILAQKTVYIPNEWRNPWPSDSLLYKERDFDQVYLLSGSLSL